MKNLWHPTSEKPKSKDRYCSIYIFDKNKYIHNVLYIEEENSWETLIDSYHGIAWCYINNLLPKKGGEQ